MILFIKQVARGTTILDINKLLECIKEVEKQLTN